MVKINIIIIINKMEEMIMMKRTINGKKHMMHCTKTKKE